MGMTFCKFCLHDAEHHIRYGVLARGYEWQCNDCRKVSHERVTSTFVICDRNPYDEPPRVPDAPQT